jgi:putative flavoprotein involved in K+ transport
LGIVADVGAAPGQYLVFMPKQATPRSPKIERIETVVIGGGQAGLAVGRLLMRRGRAFVILDGTARTGDSWRQRWDSLVLFTPARYNGLPGMRFPAPSNSFVTKDQMADFLEQYARRFDLPIRHGCRVTRLARRGPGFTVQTGDTIFEADNVVVAMAGYQTPKVPAFASELDAGIVQLHSSQYKNPDQLAPGSVLVVGVGNSGADISLELSRTHATYLSGVETGTIPFRIETFFGNRLGIRMVRFVGQYVLSDSNPVGRKAKAALLKKAGPLVRVKPSDLADAGVERLARVTAVDGGRPRVEDGSTLDVDNVVWCTGYRPGFEWIELPIFDPKTGYPRHERGVAVDQPGLFFVGLHFLHAATSATVTGVSRDAKYIARAVASRMRALGGRAAADLQPAHG